MHNSGAKTQNYDNDKESQRRVMEQDVPLSQQVSNQGDLSRTDQDPLKANQKHID